MDNNIKSTLFSFFGTVLAFALIMLMIFGLVHIKKAWGSGVSFEPWNDQRDQVRPYVESAFSGTSVDMIMYASGVTGMTLQSQLHVTHSGELTAGEINSPTIDRLRQEIQDLKRKGVVKTEIIERIVEKVVEVEGPTKTIILKEEVNMFSLWNLVILVIIILVVIKFIAPRVTIKNMIRAIWRCIIRPGRTHIRDIKQEIRDLEEKDKKPDEE